MNNPQDVPHGRREGCSLMCSLASDHPKFLYWYPWVEPVPRTYHRSGRTDDAHGAHLDSLTGMFCAICRLNLGVVYNVFIGWVFT